MHRRITDKSKCSPGLLTAWHLSRMSCMHLPAPGLPNPEWPARPMQRPPAPGPCAPAALPACWPEASWVPRSWAAAHARRPTWPAGSTSDARALLAAQAPAAGAASRCRPPVAAAGSCASCRRQPCPCASRCGH